MNEPKSHPPHDPSAPWSAERKDPDAVKIAESNLKAVEDALRHYNFPQWIVPAQPPVLPPFDPQAALARLDQLEAAHAELRDSLRDALDRLGRAGL